MPSNLSISMMTAGLLLIEHAAAAQQPVPIYGVTAKVALEGTVEKTYAGLNTVVIKALDGIEYVFHLTERTVVHGRNATGDDVLRGLDEGGRVVVHYTVDGDRKTADEVDHVGTDGLQTVAGVITNVDRRAKTMSIRLADGSVQTFRLTERAVAYVDRDMNTGAVQTKVIVYVTDEAGRPMAHYFKRVS